MTVFPGNSQQTSLTKRPAPDDAESSGRLSASKIPKVPDFHRSQRLHPPALPVKATPHSRLSTQSSRFPKFPREPIGQRSIKCQKGTPWQDHFAILEEEQAGTVTIAHRVEHEHGIVAIRKQECSDGTADKTWARCHHDSVVTLHGTYLDGNTLFFVYDFMEVSLAEALLSPVGKLARYQIAAICQEVSDSSPMFPYALTPLYVGVEGNRVHPRTVEDSARRHHRRHRDAGQRRQRQARYGVNEGA